VLDKSMVLSGLGLIATRYAGLLVPFHSR